MPDKPLRRRDAFFGLHFDLHPKATDTELGADTTEENIRALLERVGPDFVQYDCKGHAGYTGYPTEVGWSSPGIVNDALGVWRKVTREHGVALLIHYSGVQDYIAVAEHPEWAAVHVARRDGRGRRARRRRRPALGAVDGLPPPPVRGVPAPLGGRVARVQARPRHHQ
jgi:hypothetical protein